MWDKWKENQISAECRYIEIIQTFEIEQIITDTIWIYAPYLIFKSGVKLKSLKMRLYENQKGESIGSDSPFWVWIPPGYPKWILREFRSNYGGISWPPYPHKKRISQIFGSFEKFWLVGEYQNKVKQKFSTFSRQHFPCAGLGRFW